MGNLARGSVALVAIAAVALAIGATPAPKATARSVCGDLESVVIAGVTTCTHGGDEPVPDLVEAGGSGSLASRGVTPPAPCPGNGRAGRRIRVLLGYPSDTPAPDAAAARPLIKQAIALADQNLDVQSPSELGQHYRFWCSRDRAVSITSVRLVPIGDDGSYTFSNVANALQAKGYDDPAFVYVVFVANIDCCYPYGGQGSLALDDQPDPARNANNALATRYSMIRFGVGYAAGSLALAFQHETGHNLGAVQNSAPHASGGFHCYESYDTMCYPDGGSTSSMAASWSRRVRCLADRHVRLRLPRRRLLQRRARPEHLHRGSLERRRQLVAHPARRQREVAQARITGGRRPREPARRA